MNILLVDDDTGSRAGVAEFLLRMGHQVTECRDGEEALAAYAAGDFPMVLSDIRMPKLSGLELLRRIAALSGNKTDAVLVTGHKDMETAIEALQAGVYGYLLKPINVAELAAITDRIAEHQSLLRENKVLTERFSDEVRAATENTRQELSRLKKIILQAIGLKNIGIFSKEMRNIRQQVKKYHENRSIPVLIEGEPGAGKEINSKIIHKDGRQVQTALQASEARYRAIVEDQTEMICRSEPGGKLTFANEAFCRYFGIRQKDAVFQSLASILPGKAYQHIKGILKTLTLSNPLVMNTHDIKMLDGKVHWLQWTNRAIFVDTGKLKEYQLVGRDITELKEVEEALRESKEKNSIFLSAIPDPILRIDQHGTFIDLRSKKGQGLYVPSDFVGKNIAEFFSPDIVTLMMENIDKIFQEGTSQIFQFNIKQGEIVSHQEVRLVFAGENEALAILRDITERNKLEQELQYLCIHDSLTGLYNWGYFAEEMRRLESGRCHPVGIVVCDIDGLKIVNDNLGHGMGDELLKTASSILQQAFRGNDTVARIGGDEFAILLPNVTQEVVAEACKRLRKTIAEYNQAKAKLFIGISVGAAVSSHDSPDLGEIFKQADEDMYGDKLSRNKVVRDTMVQALPTITSAK
ncbi:MAG TPA: diguanylate cyclase [Negativicutes bacterium]